MGRGPPLVLAALLGAAGALLRDDDGLALEAGDGLEEWGPAHSYTQVVRRDAYLHLPNKMKLGQTLQFLTNSLIYAEVTNKTFLHLERCGKGCDLVRYLMPTLPMDIPIDREGPMNRNTKEARRCGEIGDSDCCQVSLSVRRAVMQHYLAKHIPKSCYNMTSDFNGLTVQLRGTPNVKTFQKQPPCAMISQAMEKGGHEHNKRFEKVKMLVGKQAEANPCAVVLKNHGQVAFTVKEKLNPIETACTLLSSTNVFLGNDVLSWNLAMLMNPESASNIYGNVPCENCYGVYDKSEFFGMSRLGGIGGPLMIEMCELFGDRWTGYEINENYTKTKIEPSLSHEIFAKSVVDHMLQKASDIGLRKFDCHGNIHIGG